MMKWLKKLLRKLHSSNRLEVSPVVNITIYADSQTNGEEVGKLAGQAYLDYINSRGGQ